MVSNLKTAKTMFFGWEKDIQRGWKFVRGVGTSQIFRCCPPSSPPLPQSKFRIQRGGEGVYKMCQEMLRNDYMQSLRKMTWNQCSKRVPIKKGAL